MKRNNRAFSMVEIIIALFVVTMATFLLGTLGQRVAQFSNKSKQIGTILELRTRMAAVSRDPERFLTKMQTVAVPGTSVLYNSCLSSAAHTPTSFTCPPVKKGLLNPNNVSYDAELAKYADGNYHVTDTDLVDSRGEKIAGTLADPLYLSADGLECSATPKNKKCPLMSTGYFFRTTEAENADPGDVKFIVKLQSNPESTQSSSGMTPMKAQYMTIELGRQWVSAASPCPGTSVQVGVRRDGSPMCLIPVDCGPASLLVGVKPDASPDCKAIPSCATNKRIIFNDAGNLECVGTSPCDPGDSECVVNFPCDPGQAHLGYYAGTSNPICSSPTSCANNEILLGSTCKKVETCSSKETLTFANNSFSCITAPSVSGEGCDPGEFLVGFDSKGKAKCEAVKAGKDGKDGTDGKDATGVAADACAVGSFVSGVRANGTLICSSGGSGGGGSGVGYDQEWVSVVKNRVLATVYKNESEKPITVNISLGDYMIPYVKAAKGAWVPLTVSTSDRGPITFVVPPNHSYKVEGRRMPDVWNELK